MQTLRFLTCGSVDDGKSTLIGRLFYDCGAILTDQLLALQAANRKNDDGSIDLAILTDGLKAEREQGITIDVAYKYFQTDKRKFIVIDAPGHVQYTRNMVTGASNADAAVVLIDAHKGVVEQTIRHTYLLSLLRIQHVVVCVNKMDLVDYNEERFNQIVSDYQTLAQKVGIQQIHAIPICALKGDNVVSASSQMNWYKGKTLLSLLENTDSQTQRNATPFFPVQWVIRPQSDDLPDYRGYAGKVSGGTFRVGDVITVLPSGAVSTISKIELFDKQLAEAIEGQSVTIHLKDNIDVGRGDVLVNAAHQPLISQAIEADICWMDATPSASSQTYLLLHNSKFTRCKLSELHYKINIDTLKKTDTDALGLNDIGLVNLKTAEPIAFESYQTNKTNGGAVVIDARTNLTVAALLFREPMLSKINDLSL